MGAAGWRLSGYTIEELLGVGADSEVWRGRVGRTGSLVALKRIRLIRPGLLAAAHAEAAILASIDHPNLLRIHDVVDADAAVVLVLDLADGGSLAQLTHARGRLTPGEVISALAPVAGALAQVHAAGVVHGDVTPANVLFTDIGLPLLADLGVARILDNGGAIRTTPAFAEPSVAAGHLPTEASDVFMLGGVALQALTGRPVWTGTVPAELLATAAGGALEDFAARLESCEVPAAMAAVVCRALDADPRRRGTAAEFALDLRHTGTPVAVELTAGRPRPHPVIGHESGPAAEPACRSAGTNAPHQPDRSDQTGRSRAHADRPPGGGGRHAARPTKVPPAVRRRAAGDRVRVAQRSRPVPGEMARPSFARPNQSAAGALPLTHGVRPRPVITRPAARRSGRRQLQLQLRHWTHRPAAWIAVVGIGLILAEFVWWGPTGRHHPGAAPNQPISSRPIEQSPSSLRSSSSAVAGPAARRDPVAAATAQLVRLDAIRGQAFAARSPRLLAQVYSAPALERRDIALLGRLVPAGCGLQDLRTTFSRVTARPTAAGFEVTALAQLSRSTLICGGSTRGQAAGTGPVELHIRLRAEPDGYRIDAQSTA